MVAMRALRVLAMLAVLAGPTTVAACSGDETTPPVNAGPTEATPLTVRSSPAPSTTTAPPTTAATSTSTTAAPTTTATAPAASTDYAPTPPPALPEHSAAPPTGDSFPDGLYYGVAKEPGLEPTPHLTVSIYEMLSGPAAIAAATADGVGLDSDFYIRSGTTADRRIDLTPTVAISVAQPDDPTKSYTVSAAELVRLMTGGAPAAGAPPTYRYVPFPLLVTVQAGTPVRVEQLWSP
jgi:hypothetical protein